MRGSPGNKEDYMKHTTMKQEQQIDRKAQQGKMKSRMEAYQKGYRRQDAKRQAMLKASRKE